MDTNRNVRKNVKCSQCGKIINRLIWNYGKNRSIINFFCNNVCKGNWQREQREALGFTKEWLVEQYCNQEKSANQIACEIGRDAKGVWRWIKDYGIETRPRGHNLPPPTPSGSDNPFYGKKHSKKTKEKIRQARIEDGRMPCMKDGVHWMKHDDYSQEDHPSWQGGITPERQALYSSPEWSEVVKKVWKRDKAKCQRCGKHHNTKENRGTFHIHHVISFVVEETRIDLNNLVLLCKECHHWVHSNKNINNDFIKEIHDVS